jgi:type IV secretion system protein TrbL
MLLMALPLPGYASEILGRLAKGYQSATGQWASTLFPMAKGLFIKLALLEILWSGLRWVLERDDPNQILVSFLRKIMGLMFFWAILLNFDSWIPAIIEGFTEAGARAAGLSTLTPTTLFDRGLELSSNLVATFSEMGLLETKINKFLIGGLAALGILLSFAVIAGQMLVTLVESYICVSGGVIFLGFAGSRWTTPFAEKYLSYCVSVGVKLFFTYLIVGAGASLTDQWVQMINTDMEVSHYLEILAGSLVYMFLAWQIPSVAGSVLSGTVSMTLGGAMATTGTMAAGTMGIAGGAVGTAVAGGTALVGNAVGAAKLGSAAMEAVRTNEGSSVTTAIKAVGSSLGGAALESLQGMGTRSTSGQFAKSLQNQNASRIESQAAAGTSGAIQSAPHAPTTQSQSEGASKASQPPAPSRLGAFASLKSQAEALSKAPSDKASSTSPPLNLVHHDQ